MYKNFRFVLITLIDALQRAVQNARVLLLLVSVEIVTLFGLDP
jgi:hypothetical protein